jgi:Xaa-Pro aminopeptidase
MLSNASENQALLKRYGVDAIAITHPRTVQWATGFVSSNALLYVDRSRRVLITDGRYAEAAKQLADVEVVVANQGNLATALKPHIKTGSRVGFQAEHLSVAEHGHFEEALPGVALMPLTDLLRDEIARKSAAEMAATQRAQQITDAVFSEMLEIIKPGVSERELAAEIVYRQLQGGASGISPEFWPIVASGPNSALPHAQPTDRKITKNDVVLLDFGCTVDGYCSDMTRTVYVGAPSPKFREVYETVLAAQEAALALVRGGVIASEVDKAARTIIETASYTLPHGLGHGVGLEIHEWPALNPRNPDPLPTSAVVTIEPGIYLPGEFGVRIEDMVQLTDTGCRNLTSSSKELMSL